MQDIGDIATSFIRVSFGLGVGFVASKFETLKCGFIERRVK